MVFDFTIEDGKVVEIDLIADPERIRELEPTRSWAPEALLGGRVAAVRTRNGPGPMQGRPVR